MIFKASKVDEVIQDVNVGKTKKIFYRLKTKPNDHWGRKTKGVVALTPKWRKWEKERPQSKVYNSVTR